MWELDHNEAEHQRIDAFKLWHLRRLLRILWTAKRSNQSILKEINPECSLEELMLKHQYFSHLMRRADSLEKTLILGKIDGRRSRCSISTGWMNGWMHDSCGKCSVRHFRFTPHFILTYLYNGCHYPHCTKEEINAQKSSQHSWLVNGRVRIWTQF